jgi:predicted nucleic acid-binding protein
LETYFDTSLLLKVYILEASTPEALKILRAQEPPIPFSHLLELELRTAIRLKYGRKEISTAEVRSVLQAVEADLANGVLVRPNYDILEVFRRAESLSEKHAAMTLARSADIWHVAAALEAGCTNFASFDERQRKIASLAGLKIIPGKNPKR